MTKCTWIATIVVGGAWCVLTAGCTEPPNRPATQLSAKPATQPAFDLGKLDLGEEDSNSAPPSKFFDSAANAHHIVYVVDCSGSMAPTFQEVQVEILKSINKLQPAQDFSIVFFGDGQFSQGPQKRLVSADPENKLAAGSFVEKVYAQGATQVLPALKRAFQLLKHADPRKPGRMVYLLSDGDFAGIAGGSTYKEFSGNEAIIQWLRDNNPKEEAKGLVHVNTVLYLNNDEEAKKVMKTIAKDSGGRFKLIIPDE